MLDGDRKQSAKDHIGRRVARVFFYLDLTALKLRQTRDCRFGIVPNCWKCLAQTATLKGGINNPALTLPCLAIGQKDAFHE